MEPTVSIVIVSRQRPWWLARCLTAVGQLDYPPFEVVVVADAAGRAAVAAHGLARAVKLVGFDEANISAARNAGIAAAGGEVIAFIDDDAVPEPGWLRAMAAAMEGVEAVSGKVLGRNGISVQSFAESILPTGETVPLAKAPGGAIKCVGTNMAVRRETLANMGGFDEAYRFYLDDADLSLRLAAAGCRVAVSGAAVVHHGFAGSERRSGDRVPLNLVDIGRSLAVFLGRHLDAPARSSALTTAREAELRRARRWRDAGRIGPETAERLMAGFDLGVVDGQKTVSKLSLFYGTPAFEPALSGAGRRHFAVARLWSGRARAAALAASGARVSLYRFWPGIIRHRVRFHPDGYWEQSGGLFGKSQRDDPAFRWWRHSARLARELDRCAAHGRGVPEMEKRGARKHLRRGFFASAMFRLYGSQ